MTLPQVIALIDKRLIQLELFSKNIQGTVKAGAGAAAAAAAPAVNKDDIVNAVLDEFQSRFDVMAEEIAEMKQIVMHLQSYTMDVNKMLLSQLQQTGVFTFSTSENNTSGSDEGEESA
jgi:curli biogenesis system outer membrane secretion channel CsgG